MEVSKRVLVSGYYGFNNTGDEAILKGLIDGLKNTIPGIEIVVLSKYPEFTSSKYNVKSVNRSSLREIISAIKNTDMLISGGGSLLQDVTSKKSILYYLFIIKLAQILEKKTFIYSQGIGPIRNYLNRLLTRMVLNRVDGINVRDMQSKEVLEELGVTKDILVTIDTVFGIERPSLEIGKKILENLGMDLSKILIGVNIMDWKEYGSRTLDEFTKAFKKILKNEDVQVVLIPFYYYQDLNICKLLYKNLQNFENIFLLEDYLHVTEYLSVIGNTKIMLSMRLHGLIFGAFMNSYPIGVSYDPKIDGLMRELDRPTPMQVETFTSERLIREVNDAILNLDKYRESTASKLEHFYEKARLHNEAVKKLLE